MNNVSTPGFYWIRCKSVYERWNNPPFVAELYRLPEGSLTWLYLVDEYDDSEVEVLSKRLEEPVEGGS